MRWGYALQAIYEALLRHPEGMLRKDLEATCSSARNQLKVLKRLGLVSLSVSGHGGSQRWVWSLIRSKEAFARWASVVAARALRRPEAPPVRSPRSGKEA